MPIDGVVEEGRLEAVAPVGGHARASAARRRTSVGAIAAGAEESELLGVAPGTPLLVCERIMLSDRREPVEYCEMKYVPSYRYRSRISK